MNLLSAHKERQSGAELLRIVAMLMIVVHHILRHIIMNETGTAAIDGNISTCLTAKFIDAFVLIGVNIFVMISGYYRIKLSLRKILSLFLLLSLYKILRLMLMLKAGNAGLIDYFGPLIPFSHCGWFIQDYFVLCLLAPIANLFIEYSSKYVYTRQLIIYAFLMVYFGFFWGMEGFADGYTVSQFIFLYFVGAYIQINASTKRWKSSTLLLTYIICSVITGIMMCLSVTNTSLRIVNFSAYDSPFMIIGSAAFFMLMMKIEFKNKWVNFIAAATLSVWLIQEGAGLGSSYCYKFMQNLYLQNTTLSFLLIAILYIIALFISALIIDNTFKYISSLVINPILKVINGIKLKLITVKGQG